MKVEERLLRDATQHGVRVGASGAYREAAMFAEQLARVNDPEALQKCITTFRETAGRIASAVRPEARMLVPAPPPHETPQVMP